MRVVLVLLVFLLVDDADSYRILGVFPGPTYSHHALGNRLMKALAEKGHNVTMISAYKEFNPPKFYRKIDLENIVKTVEAQRKNIFNNLNTPSYKLLLDMNDLGVFLVNETLSNPRVQNILQDPNEKFDVIVMEQFVADALKVLSYHFKCPLIAFSTIGSGHWVNGLVANPAPRSYVADMLSSSDGKMNFNGRVFNLFMAIVEHYNDHFTLFPKMNKLIQSFFPGAPSVEELNTNVSLVFLNSHVSTHQAVPHVPNMVEIGGFHVHPTAKPLPKDLQDFLDHSKEGVVYFNMGSFLNSKDLPKKIRAAILKAFARLPVNVLWKFEEDLEEKPGNVKIEKWLPQQDVLAHPNVKVFITHGGMLSTIEAVYYGVPLLGIPVCGDQGLNIAKAVASGFALQLNFDDLTEDTLYEALIEIMQNNRYKENAMERSRILHDQPVKPIDLAIYWTEYVVRHKGARHFRSTALDLTWYQYYMVDIVVVAVLLVVVCTVAPYKIIQKWLSNRRINLKSEKVKEKIHLL